jgi:hypothetical protein
VLVISSFKSEKDCVKVSSYAFWLSLIREPLRGGAKSTCVFTGVRHVACVTGIAECVTDKCRCTQLIWPNSSAFVTVPVGNPGKKFKPAAYQYDRSLKPSDS